MGSTNLAWRSADLIKILHVEHRENAGSKNIKVIVGKVS